MNTMTNIDPSDKRQSGTVLVISLIMLLLLTMIGVTGSQVTSLEEKMTGNMRDRNLAFQAAESALREGEALAAASAPTLACPGANPPGFFMPRDANCDGTIENTNVWDSIDWNTQSLGYDGVTNPLVDLSANPRFIVEDMGVICVSVTLPCPVADQRRNYRVTSRATGRTTDAVVILQSTIQI